MNKLLELNNVSIGYAENIILRNVNLEIDKNDFLGIIGPNGSGKTTLIKTIIGIFKPFEGSINYYGKSSKIVIGYLPQFFIKDKNFPISSFDIVLSGLINKLGSGRKIGKTHKNKAKKLFKSLGIEKIIDKRIGELSGGLAQRVFLARALISEPELLVLDEPNTFIDSNFSRDFYELLAELNNNMAIILISHELGVISSNVKNIACVNKTLHYHPGNNLDSKILNEYQCPIDILGHGEIPHRVVRKHGNN